MVRRTDPVQHTEVAAGAVDADFIELQVTHDGSPVLGPRQHLYDVSGYQMVSAMW
jgi:hypothetical protein